MKMEKYNSIKHVSLFFITAFALANLSFVISDADPDLDWDKYLKQHQNWKTERVTTLKKPFGYLSMTGLYWLHEGKQSIGSHEDNDITLPPSLPQNIGTLKLDKGKLQIQLNTSIKIDDEEKNGLVNISADNSGSPSMFNVGSHFWYVIKRGDQYGIRMKDTLADSRLSFQSMPSYDPQKKWRLKGSFQEKHNQKIDITNKVGIKYQSDLAGIVSFEYDEKQYKLSATMSGEKLFIVFADETNGISTYGGGRFLFIDPPSDQSKEVIIDFNKAENPICALSDFATCPLPRPENYLNFSVDAGEKKVR